MDRTDQPKLYDFLIAGSGFAGSITAMTLANSGYKVCLIERGKHPRFSIGESSTPIADMILRDISEKYDLPFLKKLSRYGEWQKHYSEIICGLKRGFSYYHHQKGKPFESDKFHSNELLVSASENDQNSDTNWLRSDVDRFLVERAKESEVDYLDQCEIVGVVRNRSAANWNIEVLKDDNISNLKALWIIDATGSSAFSETFLGTTSSSDGFETNSSAIFTHFDGVEEWKSYLNHRRFKTDDYPYNPDHSALHHVINEGWIWMLRFNNGVLSSGLVMDSLSNKHDGSPEELWNQIVYSYPSVKKIFEKSRIKNIPGRFYKTERLQRKLNKTHGDGWLALNHTAGFVDPLHSTGIAHSLAGVEKILNVFVKETKSSQLYNDLKKIEDEFFNELSLIDLLVSSCYLSRHHPKLFNAAVMLYFVASIQYEQGRLAGKTPGTFLCAGNSELRNMIIKTHSEIQRVMRSDHSESDVRELIQKIKANIEPFNSVGLMNSSNRNMYFHTAVNLK